MFKRDWFDTFITIFVVSAFIAIVYFRAELLQWLWQDAIENMLCDMFKYEFLNIRCPHGK